MKYCELIDIINKLIERETELCDEYYKLNPYSDCERLRHKDAVLGAYTRLLYEIGNSI